jgi:hypothetical protein
MFHVLSIDFESVERKKGKEKRNVPFLSAKNGSEMVMRRARSDIQSYFADPATELSVHPQSASQLGHDTL